VSGAAYGLAKLLELESHIFLENELFKSLPIGRILAKAQPLLLPPPAIRLIRPLQPKEQID
jgi:hypothetical protein